MIEFKEYNELPTEELRRYKEALNTDFEETKLEIKRLCEHLEKLDEEYLDVLDELDNRED